MKRGWWTSFVLALALPLLPVVGVCCLMSCAPAAANAAASAGSCHKAAKDDGASAMAVEAGGCGEHERLAGVLPATLARIDGALAAPPEARFELGPLDADRLGQENRPVRRPPDPGRFRVLRI